MIRSLAAVSVGWLGISMVADGVPALLVPYRVAAAGSDATELGLVTLVAIALAALVQPLAGAWSDRAGRLPTIAVGVVLATVGLAILVSPGALLVGTVVTLVGVSVGQAGYQSLLPDRIAPTWRGRGAGAKGLFDVGGAFLAFAILGGLLAAGQAATAAAVLAIGLVASLGIGLVLLRRRPMRPPRPGGRDSWGGPLSGVAGLGTLIAGRFLFLLAIFTVGRFLLLFVADRLGRDAEGAGGEAGAILAVLTLVTALAALPGGWLADRVGRRPMMLAGGLVASVGIAALPMADSVAWMLALGTLMALGTAMFGAGSWAMLADLTAGVRTGRLLGFANLGTAGAAAAAGLFGPVIDAGNGLAPGIGYAVAFTIAGTAALAGGLLGWRVGVPAHDHELQAVIEVPD